MAIRFFFFAFTLLLCRAASAQITYAGLEYAAYEFTFEQAGERDGEFKLLFYAHDREHGHVVREWIRPGGHFLGFRVTYEKKKGGEEVLFMPFDPGISYFSIHVGHTARSFTHRGTFIREGYADERVTAYTGDQFTLGGRTATLRGLSETQASLQFADSGETATLIISDTGVLRTQQGLLQAKLTGFETELHRLRYSLRNVHGWLFVAEAGLGLAAGFLVTYACVFLGLHQSRLKPRLLMKRAPEMVPQ